MGTKNNPGRYDCYNKADGDEPIFTLRANDPVAPRIVIEWARQYAQLKEMENRQLPKAALACTFWHLRDGYELNGDQAAKYDEAMCCAHAMGQWRQDNEPPAE